jgi:hypothetical protein
MPSEWDESWKSLGNPPPISRLKLGKQRTPRHRKTMKIEIQGRLLNTCRHCSRMVFDSKTAIDSRFFGNINGASQGVNLFKLVLYYPR